MSNTKYVFSQAYIPELKSKYITAVTMEYEYLLRLIEKQPKDIQDAIHSRIAVIRTRHHLYTVQADNCIFLCAEDTPDAKTRLTEGLIKLQKLYNELEGNK